MVVNKIDNMIKNCQKYIIENLKMVKLENNLVFAVNNKQISGINTLASRLFGSSFITLTSFQNKQKHIKVDNNNSQASGNTVLPTISFIELIVLLAEIL